MLVTVSQPADLVVITAVLCVCKGNGDSVARIIPYVALHFSTYEHFRSTLMLRSASCTDTYPLDLVRTL
jgi:hypothetical protein